MSSAHGVQEDVFTDRVADAHALAVGTPAPDMQVGRAGQELSGVSDRRARRVELHYGVPLTNPSSE